jgi:hypothetical protein
MRVSFSSECSTFLVDIAHLKMYIDISGIHWIPVGKVFYPYPTRCNSGIQPDRTHGWVFVPVSISGGYETRGYPYPWVQLPSLLAFGVGWTCSSSPRMARQSQQTQQESPAISVESGVGAYILWVMSLSTNPAKTAPPHITPPPVSCWKGGPASWSQCGWSSASTSRIPQDQLWVVHRWSKEFLKGFTGGDCRPSPINCSTEHWLLRGAPPPWAVVVASPVSVSPSSMSS